VAYADAMRLAVSLVMLAGTLAIAAPADRDRDGIVDSADKCPNEPEDRDAFQDEDGCPDPDNDGDGILDASDKCPMEPEDRDGFQDVDGCPDPDNDGDGIIDAGDQCAMEPETINGNKDDDGCPDPGDPVVMVMPDRLDLLEAIEFEGTTAKLKRKSLNVLGQVAGTLRAQSAIVRVRVTAHVNATGAHDQELSDKRAAAVREWLVQWGIAPSRVEARGFGSRKLLKRPDDKGAAQVNNRIEFVILERK
jgi:outer membrane protein OmpA-like peptidoglycan-associated protein